MSNFLKEVSGIPRATAMALTDLPSIASPSFLGNISGSAATPSALTAAQVTANLNLFSATLQGLTPASGGGTANFLRADGTWTAPAGSSPLTTKGDIYTFSTTNTRQPVPNDYGMLIADSTQTTGWRNTTYTQTQGKPGKNYVEFADFENNSTTGWTLGTIGTLTNGLPTGTPTFGSGASGNLSIATTSSSIEGAFSLNYVSSAATTQGNMVASSSYAIDIEDQAKVLTVKFYYTPVSGAANCNFSGTSSNSFAWAVYDVTNSSWLTSAGNFNLVQSLGCGYVTGTCQTNANTANIRLVIYNANATSGAATVTLDGFYVGPQTAPSGPAMTDWTSNLSITPSAGFGSIGGPPAYWSRRVGDSIEFNGYFQFGTVAASTAYLQLPSGIVIDSTKLGTATNAELIGLATTSVAVGDNPFVSFGGLVLFYDGSTTNQIFFGAGGGNAATYEKVNVSFIAAANQGWIQFNFKVPVAGWSSNTSMSSDTDTRVVAFEVTHASNLTATAGSNLLPGQVNYDTHAGYNSSTGIYTVPVSGYYDVSVAGINTTTTTSIYLNKNGAAVTRIFVASSTIGGASGSTQILVNAGDTLSIVPDNNATFEFTAFSGTDTGNRMTWNISRRSGPAVIAATESVNASYYASTTGTSSTTVPINFDTKIYDSHNATTTGSSWVYVAPVSGKYRVSVWSIATSGTNTVYLTVYKNGSALQVIAESANPSSQSPQGSGTVQLNAGDSINIRSQGNNLAWAGGAVGSTSQTSIQIERVGN